MRTVGVEEELLVVNEAGLPVPWSPQALDVAARRGDGETVEEHDRAEQKGDDHGVDDQEESAAHLMPELKAQQIELGTEVCSTLTEVGARLRHWRSRADAAAASVGARVAALATSPVPVEPIATDGDRYTALHEAFALTAREMLTCGCHVHVSTEDDQEGTVVLDRIRIWLPVLTALSANSPFWQGADSGYASFRSQAWQRWPSAGPNDPFGSVEAYERLVDDVLSTGTVLDDGMLYFDARLSAKWPTVEIRVADVLLRVEDAVTLAGLIRGLVETAGREARDGMPVPAVRSELLRLAAWRAGRSGLSGDLVHPLTGRPAPAADVLATLLEHIRPALTEAGDLDRVTEGVTELLRRGTGADLQRRVLRETGDLRAVVRTAVAVTAGEPEETAQAAASPGG
jgi:carboxylate-amine ligase